MAIIHNSEPTWTFADGRVIKISSMEDKHLINARNLMYERCRDNPLSIIWYTLRDLQREMIKRHLSTPQAAISEIAYANCANLDKTYKKQDTFNECKLPMKEVEPTPPPIISNHDIQKFIEKKRPDLFPKETARQKLDREINELKEREWQITETQILPEGDKHILVIEDHWCEVHNITRRLRVGALSDKTMPVMYASPVGMNRKKVRITIEVLED